MCWDTAEMTIMVYKNKSMIYKANGCSGGTKGGMVGPHLVR